MHTCLLRATDAKTLNVGRIAPDVHQHAVMATSYAVAAKLQILPW
jgi:hypothetical protein